MKRVSTVTVRKRIVTVFLFALLIFFIIDVRLGFVQFFLGDELVGQANDLWTRDIIFQPERGLILDSNGEALAENVTAPSIVIIPRQVKNPEDTAEKLAKVLNMDAEMVLEKITKMESSVNLRPEGIKITEKQEQNIRALNLDGVYLSKDSKRHYPFGDDLSHVLGFAGIDNQGLMGLELYYDDKLSGEKEVYHFIQMQKEDVLKH